MWIQRGIQTTLEGLAAQRPVVVLTGARQTGKTSLLRRAFPDHSYVSLDLPSEAALAESSPEQFLRAHPAPAIIDEIQYAPGLFRQIKVAVDVNRRARGSYLLTGSQKFVLMREVSDSLAGRVGVLELDTLSLAEVLSAHSDVEPLDFVVRGGFPELWEDRALVSAAFHRAYVATYLERDLRAVLRVANLRDFERFLRACALRSGQLVNKSDLARDVGISGSTANEWLGALEASSQIALLEPWFSSGSKVLAKTPKLYFCDTGLLLFLLNLRSVAELETSPLRGALFETAVYGELRRRLALGNELESLFFLRDRTKEVDFVIHRGGRFELFECKWTERPAADDAAGMAHAAGVLGADRVISRTIVCRAPHEHPGANGVRVTNLAGVAGLAGRA